MPGFLSGLVPASHTPFDRSGRLDLSVVPRQAALFRETGAAGVFVAGTTGEFTSLTVEERQLLCAAWAAEAGDDLKLVAHVGHNCQNDAIALADHARQAGAHAIAAVPPAYYAPPSIAALVDFLAPIAAAADPLPFYYYHIPGMTGVRLPAATLLKETRKAVPNLRGIKFSHSDLHELQDCVHADDGTYDVLFGQDEFLLAGLALGVQGAVGSTYNFAGPLYRRLIEAFRTGDIAGASKAQWRSARMVGLLNEYGFLPAAKAVMGLIGVECGPVRPPLRNLSGAQRAELARKLKELDVCARPIEVRE